MIRCRIHFFTLAVSLSVCASLLHAAPADLGALKEKLAKPIKAQYLDAPLDRVLENLQNEAGVPVVLDRQRLGDHARRKVALSTDSMPVSSVLNWVTRAAGVDWDVREGAVFISTRREILRPQIKTEVYDVRALTVMPPNFTGGPELDINSALSNTSSGGSSGGAATASTSLFSDDDSADTIGITPDEFADLIKGSVAPEDWNGELGVTFQSAAAGLLVVKHTPAVHAEIKDLLEKYQKSSGKMVAIEARIMIIRTDALDKMLGKVKNKLILDPKEADAFLKETDPIKNGVRVLGIGRTISMNGQRVNVSSIKAKAFLSDLEPVSGGTGADPTLSVLMSGNVVDVESIISFDGESIVLTVRSRAAAGNTDDTSAVPVGISPESVIPGTNAEGEQMPVKRKIMVSDAKVNLPEQDHVDFRTTVRIAAGGAVVLSGVSTQFEMIDAPNSEVVLFLRAHAIAPPSSKKPAGKAAVKKQ